jgi:Fe-S cluster assembly scaffold protein SufB
VASSALVTPPLVDVSILNRFPAGAVARPDREAALELAALPAPSTAINRYWRIDFARIDLGIASARPLVNPTLTAPPEAVKAGVVLCSLSEAAQTHSDLVTRHLGSVIPANESRFTALASAMEQGGYFVFVPAGAKIETPLTVSITVQNGAQWSPRSLIIVEQGASIAIHEEITGFTVAAENNALVCGTVEAIVAEDAQLTVITQQYLDEKANVFMTRRAKVARKARVRWAIAEFGGALVQSRVGCSRDREG